MEPLSATSRAANLQRLAQDQFDVLVIGGGVTGAGVALDAVARGYRVALVEKADFASGTSSKATKLVHGGIRYLPNFDFGLVHEALIERGLLLQNAPFLVQPVGFLLPIYEGDRHPVGMPFTTPGGIGLSRLLDIGLWLYDILAGRRNIRRHRHLSRERVLAMAPTLVTNGLKEGFIYYDAQTNDTRLTMTLIRTAAQYGATIANYAKVTSFIKEDGKISGAHVYDQLSDQEVTIHSRYVINATGVFSDQLEAMTGDDPQIKIVPSKGVHLVFSREDLQIGDDAIVLPETEDKRLLFIVPWESRVILGTTDTGPGDLDNPTLSPEDVDYLLHYLNRYLSVNLTRENIISTYAGYRPLVKPARAGQSSSRLSRSHVVLQSPSGLVTITGGKLTTYRRMAQDTLDVISKRDSTKPIHPTEHLPLQGAAGWPVLQKALERRGMELGLSGSILAHLGHNYGIEANDLLDLIADDSLLAQRLIDDLPYLRAEVVYACRNEMAMTLEDVLARRTRIILEDGTRGVSIASEVANLMAAELNWSSEQTHAQVEQYRTLVGQQIKAEDQLQIAS